MAEENQGKEQQNIRNNCNNTNNTNNSNNENIFINNQEKRTQGRNIRSSIQGLNNTIQTSTQIIVSNSQQEILQNKTNNSFTPMLSPMSNPSDSSSLQSGSNSTNITSTLQTASSSGVTPQMNHIYLSENTNSNNVPIQISSRALFASSNKDIFNRNQAGDSNIAKKLQSLLNQENKNDNNINSQLQSEPESLITKQQQDQLLLENYKTYNSKHLETSFSSYSNDEIYNISSCSVFNNNNISKLQVQSDNPLKQQQLQQDQQYCSYGNSAQVFLEESQSKMVALENEISKLTDQNQKMSEEIEQLKQVQSQQHPQQFNLSNGTSMEVNKEIQMLQERLKQQDIVIAREQQKYAALSQSVQTTEQLFQQKSNESKRIEEMLRRQIDELTAEKKQYQLELQTLQRKTDQSSGNNNIHLEQQDQPYLKNEQDQQHLNDSLKDRIRELEEKVAELLESKYEQEQLVESYKKMTEESQKMNAESLGINETHINRIRELEQAIAASSSLVDKLAQKDVYIAQLIHNSENDKLALQAETTSVLEQMKRLESNHQFELQLVRKKADEEKQSTLEEINQLKIEIGTKADNFMQLQQLQALNQQLLEQLQLAETTNVQISEQQEQELQEKLSQEVAEQTYSLNSQLNNLKIAMRELEVDNNQIKLQMDQQVTRFNNLVQQHTNAIAEKDQTISQLERQIHNLAQQSERTLQNFRAEKDREVAFVQREHQRMQLLLQEKMEVISKINSIQANNPAVTSQQLQLQQQQQGQLLQGGIQAPTQLYSQLQSQQQYSQQQPFNSFDRQYPPPLPQATTNLLANSNNNYSVYSKYRHPSLLDGQHANSILLRKNASLNSLSPSDTSLEASHQINTTINHEERLNQTIKRPPLPVSSYMSTQQHLLHLSRQMPTEEPLGIGMQQQTTRQMEGSALSQMKVTDPSRFDTSIVDENDVLNKMILERCKNIVEGIPNNNNTKINSNTNSTPNNKPIKSSTPSMN